MSDLKKLTLDALIKAGGKVTSSQLYELLGTNEPKPKFNATLLRLKNTGKVKAFPGESPHKTLYASSGVEPPPKGTDTTGKRTAGKRGKHPKPPAPVSAPRKNGTGNVGEFTPAMTADKRLVIVGGSEPLIFSPEQTQSIADLVFDNFETC